MVKPGNVLCYSCMRAVVTGKSCPLCGAPIPYEARDVLDLKPGTVLNGKYTIGRCLGRGGFGATYLAMESSLGGRFAIKEYFYQACCTRAVDSNEIVVKPGMEEDFRRFKEKFHQEARRLQEFQHSPGVVKCLEYFEENGAAYFVMEYLEGVTLMDFMRKRGTTLTADELIPILLRALKALEQVHAKGYIHRDISPDNLFLLQGGEIKLIDFGSARQTSARSMTRLAKGSYTAPEQEFNREQTPATDLYALGVSIFTLLVGRQPEKQPLTGSGSRYKLEPLPADTPSSLQTIYTKATAFDARNRYRTAPEMAAAINLAFPGFIPTTGSYTTFSPSPKRQIGRIIGLVSILLALAAVVLILLNQPSALTSEVTIRYYNQQGNLLNTVNQSFSKGTYTITADDDMVPPGHLLTSEREQFLRVNEDGSVSPGNIDFIYMQTAQSAAGSVTYDLLPDQDGGLFIIINGGASVSIQMTPHELVRANLVTEKHLAYPLYLIHRESGNRFQVVDSLDGSTAVGLQPGIYDAALDLSGNDLLSKAPLEIRAGQSDYQLFFDDDILAFFNDYGALPLPADQALVDYGAGPYSTDKLEKVRLTVFAEQAQPNDLRRLMYHVNLHMDVPQGLSDRFKLIPNGQDRGISFSQESAASLRMTSGTYEVRMYIGAAEFESLEQITVKADKVQQNLSVSFDLDDAMSLAKTAAYKIADNDVTKFIGQQLGNATGLTLSKVSLKTNLINLYGINDDDVVFRLRLQNDDNLLSDPLPVKNLGTTVHLSPGSYTLQAEMNNQTLISEPFYVAYNNDVSQTLNFDTSVLTRWTPPPEGSVVFAYDLDHDERNGSMMVVVGKDAELIMNNPVALYPVALSLDLPPYMVENKQFTLEHHESGMTLNAPYYGVEPHQMRLMAGSYTLSITNKDTPFEAEQPFLVDGNTEQITILFDQNAIVFYQENGLLPLKPDAMVLRARGATLLGRTGQKPLEVDARLAAGHEAFNAGQIPLYPVTIRVDLPREYDNAVSLTLADNPDIAIPLALRPGPVEMQVSAGSYRLSYSVNGVPVYSPVFAFGPNAAADYHWQLDDAMADEYQRFGYFTAQRGADKESYQKLGSEKYHWPQLSPALPMYETPISTNMDRITGFHHALITGLEIVNTLTGKAYNVLPLLDSGMSLSGLQVSKGSYLLRLHTKGGQVDSSETFAVDGKKDASYSVSFNQQAVLSLLPAPLPEGSFVIGREGKDRIEVMLIKDGQEIPAQAPVQLWPVEITTNLGKEHQEMILGHTQSGQTTSLALRDGKAHILASAGTYVLEALVSGIRLTPQGLPNFVITDKKVSLDVKFGLLSGVTYPNGQPSGDVTAGDRIVAALDFGSNAPASVQTMSSDSKIVSIEQDHSNLSRVVIRVLQKGTATVAITDGISRFSLDLKVKAYEFAAAKEQFALYAGGSVEAGFLDKDGVSLSGSYLEANDVKGLKVSAGENGLVISSVVPGTYDLPVTCLNTTITVKVQVYDDIKGSPIPPASMSVNEVVMMDLPTYSGTLNKLEIPVDSGGVIKVEKDADNPQQLRLHALKTGTAELVLTLDGRIRTLGTIEVIRLNTAHIKNGVGLFGTYFFLDEYGQTLLLKRGSDRAYNVLEPKFIKLLANDTVVVGLTEEGELYAYGNKINLDRWFDRVSRGRVTLNYMDIKIKDFSLTDSSLVYILKENGIMQSDGRRQFVKAGGLWIHFPRTAEDAPLRPLQVSHEPVVPGTLELQPSNSRSHNFLAVPEGSQDGLNQVFTIGHDSRYARVNPQINAGNATLNPVRVWAAQDALFILTAEGRLYSRETNQKDYRLVRNNADFNSFNLVHVLPMNNHTYFLDNQNRLYLSGKTSDSLYKQITLVAQEVAWMQQVSSEDVMLFHTDGSISLYQNGVAVSEVSRLKIKYP